MVFVSLFHGMAFMVLGLIAALQASTSVRLLPKRAVYLLSAFASIRGIAMWMEASSQIAQPGSLVVAQIGKALVVPAFLILALLGTELIAYFGTWEPRTQKYIRLLPCLPLALMPFVVPEHANVAEAIVNWQLIARYFFALPGALLTALGFFWAASVRSGAKPNPMRRQFLIIATAFALYGTLAGLFGPAASFFPANILNSDVFFAHVGMPVSLLRAVCAAVIAAYFSHAYTIEVGRIEKSVHKAREDFLSMVAHDLRGPLTCIHLSAELLSRKLTGPEATQDRNILQHVLSSAKRLDRMLSDLLDASLADVNHLPLKLARVDMSFFVEEAVERAAQDRRVVIDLPRLPVFCEVDPDRMDQVMNNLLSNARKYSTPDTPIYVRGRMIPEAFEMTITNEGPGIQHDEQELVFSRYYRSRSAQKGDEKGNGLGLFITKALIEAHGGKISVHSEPGRSTTFRFLLPVA